MPVDRPSARPLEVRPASASESAAVFVDANVFLRYLTDDVPEQAAAVEALLGRAAQGDVRLVTSVLVVAEVVWTLGSFYKHTKPQVRDAVLALCHTPGLDVEDADALVQAAVWHADLNVDFADAVHAAWMRAHGLATVATFNLKHFRRFDGLSAEEPS
ncbi:MAG TPA: PIN domain-containing protein [Rubricoccaceae bacterium]|jgi:predicted nucleic acid-binding protein